MGDPTDEEIWQQTLSGDSRAFGLIWDRHRNRVFRHLLASGNSPADAEDLSAAAFLELWRRRAMVRFVDGSVLPWLIATAQNVHRNAARSRRRHRTFLSSLPAPEHTADHAERFADQNDDRLTRLRAAMTRSRPIDASLLSMTVLEGFSIREAAIALGLSESAAKMRLSRLRARLRADLAPRPMEEGA